VFAVHPAVEIAGRLVGAPRRRVGYMVVGGVRARFVLRRRKLALAAGRPGVPGSLFVHVPIMARRRVYRLKPSRVPVAPASQTIHLGGRDQVVPIP